MSKLRSPAPAVLAVLLSGTMSFLSAGINHVWIAAWLAPIPLLVALLDLRAAQAASAAFVASAIGALSFVVAYRGLPPVLLASVVLLFAVPFTCVALVWRAIARRARPIVAVVAYPALVTSAEYLTSLVSPHGTFGSLAYSQADVPALIQLASVTGLWGISFLLSLVPAALAIAWRHRHEGKIAAAVLASGALPLGLSLVFGAVRLAGPAPANHVRVGLAVSDVEAARHFAARDPVEGLPVVRAYGDRAAALAKGAAQVVVLPEKFVGIAPEYADRARAILGDVARNGHVTIVAGFNLLSSPERRNVAVVFGTDGEVALEYDKQHLVPGLEEGYRRGEAIGIIPGAGAATGVAICKDLDFVPLGREYARAGVGLLLVPAWDFVNDGWLHSRMAVLRGVEGGYAVARGATNGLLTVSDARGRILAERSSGESAEVLLAAIVPIGLGGTFYSRTGDWFAWMCICAVIACIAAGWRNRHLTTSLTASRRAVRAV
jgi:apolipoprotein N-acyltransferase